MTRDEIWAVTESDAEGCEAINKAVHEKLGLCWHEWKDDKAPFHGDYVFHCKKCARAILRNASDAEFKAEHPDYTHDISAAWAIKEWLYGRGAETKHDFICALSWGRVKGHPCWASAMERCKAFLSMEG